MHRQAYLVKSTLGLVRIMGQLAETENKALFMEAKKTAQAMALELNMPESFEELVPVSDDTDKLLAKYCMSVGRLAKACEALDHLEVFPYRETFEKNISIILKL